MPPKHRRGIKNTDSVVMMRRLLKRERHLQMSGRVLKVPSHPPEFTAIPWNQVTLRILSPSSGFFTDLELTTALRSQLHITANQPMAWRLHSVRFWANLIGANPVDSTLSSAAIRIYSLIPEVAGSSSAVTTNHAVLEEIRDYPDQVRRASVGFEWPLSHQSISITGGAPPSFSLINIQTGSGATSLLYFRLWWRTAIA